MSMPETERDALDQNEYFETLGYSGDDFLVRLKSSGSTVRFIGRPNNWMLSLIAPMSWWSSRWSLRGRGTTAQRAFVRACSRRGPYAEEAIARRIADEKRAAQPAPVLTESGLPAAVIVAETGGYFHVQCPHCGGVHRHGAGLLGRRVPHCWGLYPDASDYELVRPSASSVDHIELAAA
ncbi:hypothetical protein [Paraburkholderia sp. SIMBA_053]|uniref:hypothetical protein n=1 Tax=Paraburkholderia sp. SIMBA_053 TaxID=3085794 RepID=UPI00397BB1DE